MTERHVEAICILRILILIIGVEPLKELKIKSQYEYVGFQILQEKLIGTTRLSLVTPSNETEKSFYLREWKLWDIELWMQRDSKKQNASCVPLHGALQRIFAKGIR